MKSYETDRQTDRQAGMRGKGSTDRQMDGQIARRTVERMDKHSHIQTGMEGETDRNLDRQKDGQLKVSTNNHTNKQA